MKNELIKNDDDINIEQIQIFVNYYDRKIKLKTKIQQ